MKRLLKRVVVLIVLIAICAGSIHVSVYAQMAWNGGYNANVKIENTSNVTIENWYLEFKYNDTITIFPYEYEIVGTLVDS